LLVFFVPSSFNGTHPEIVVFLVLTAPIFSYAAYWAFSIRRALAVPLYRRQAFGIGFIVLAFWFAIGALIVPTGGPLAVGVTLGTFSFYFLWITLFYWIDASVLASRRSDPLLRDTLFWSRIRIPLWIVNIISWVIPLSVTAYAAGVGNVPLLNQLNSGTFGNSIVDQAFSVIYNILPVLVLICGVVYLPAIGIRAKSDRSLRSHFMWFTVTIVGLLALFFGLASASTAPVGHLAPALVFVLIGYSLYRSARALVPLNKVSVSLTESISKPGDTASSLKVSSSGENYQAVMSVGIQIISRIQSSRAIPVLRRRDTTRIA
jgi:hypothetical protein